MKPHGSLRLGAVTSLFCVAAAAVATAQGITPPGQPTPAELQEIRSTYIVQLSSSVDPSEIQGRANAIAARFNGQVKSVYNPVLNGFSIRMSEQALSNMIATTGLGIARVYRDRPVSAYAPKGDKGGPPTGGTSSGCPETLGWDIGRVTGITQGGSNCSITDPSGANFATLTSIGTDPLKVCVIDTGVSLHPDLNVIEGTADMNFSSDRGATEDLNGHGSHVAGTIGAKANGFGVVGVAPGAFITPIKVLNRRGSGSMSGVMDGVRKAVEIGCDIANMSLGASDPYNDFTVLDLVVQNAANAGVIFTLAAGNSFEDIASHTPARASTTGTDNIFTIASFGKDKKGADLWSYFSNFDLGSATIGMVDFALPGGAITSTWKDGGYNTISGTSMAAPHMAGLLVRLGTTTIRNGTTAEGTVSNAAFGTAGGTVMRVPYPSGVASEPPYAVASD